MTTATTSTEIGLYLNSGTYDYDIAKTDSGNTIFKGRAIAPTLVDVGAIVKDFLEVSVPYLTQSGITQHTAAQDYFALVANGDVLAEWFVRDDYSGEAWNGSDTELSQPINGHTDPRQRLLYSAFFNNSESVNITEE